MPHSFFDFTPDDGPGSIYRLESDEDWDALVEDLSPEEAPVRPLARVLELAREHLAQSALVEYRYIDMDYRSEHANFYGSTFRRYPSVTWRVHFFSAEVEDNLGNLAELGNDYIGYMVLRPLPKSPVGRTMMRPPPGLTNFVHCYASDEVHLFGHKFTVRAMPFVSQDAQYFRCAHASEWMVLYHAHLRYGIARSLPADIQVAASGGGGVTLGRQLPSGGLSASQMLTSLERLGLSPDKKALPETKRESEEAVSASLPAYLCRYVNSQLPPIVLSRSHAWVVVGYERFGQGHDGVKLWRHDDASGPYIPVDDPWDEPDQQLHGRWQIAIPPLPKKAYLTAERAESIAQLWLDGFVDANPRDRIVQDADGNQRDLAVRTYLIDSSSFKASTIDRLPDLLSDFYRLTHLPHYIWVVEVIDRNHGDLGANCVVGEIVFDATAHQLSDNQDDQAKLVTHFLGRISGVSPDHCDFYFEEVDDLGPYRSACPGIED